VTCGVAPGDRVAVALEPSAAWLILALALAKLGATPAVLPPGGDAAARAAAAGALLLDPAHLPALAAPHAVAPRRLSGTHPPAPTVTFTAGGEPVVRSFGPERLAAARVPLGDLLSRLRTAPGAIHLLAAPLHLAPARLHADVTLVNGGTVVAAGAPGPERLLELVAEHEVTTTFLSAAQAAALAAVPPAVRDGADLLSLQLLLCEGPAGPRGPRGPRGPGRRGRPGGAALLRRRGRRAPARAGRARAHAARRRRAPRRPGRRRGAFCAGGRRGLGRPRAGLTPPSAR
jgi:hypothetical protein